MKGYKTVVLNGAVAALPVVDLVISNGAFVNMLLGTHGAAVMSILGLANLVLRWVTDTPIFKGE